MDQKKTQRIIGIVIVIALVIILFPLLFSKNESQPTVTTVQAPPFPEQPAASPVELAKDDTIQPLTQTELPLDAPAKEVIADTVQPVKSQNVKMTTPVVTPAPANQVLPLPMEEMLAKKPVIKEAKLTHPIKKASYEPRTHIKHSEVVKLNQLAWAIQMGSFKDKNNAHRLTDKLRSAGYKAFTREVAAKHGTQMRVYVGPEFKQLAALKLSSELEHNMNMHGIIVVYKPLAL